MILTIGFNLNLIGHFKALFTILQSLLTQGQFTKGGKKKSTEGEIFRYHEGRFDPFTGRRKIKRLAVIEWLKRKGFIVDTIGIVEKRHGEIRTNLQRTKKNLKEPICPNLHGRNKLTWKAEDQEIS